MAVDADFGYDFEGSLGRRGVVLRSLFTPYRVIISAQTSRASMEAYAAKLMRSPRQLAAWMRTNPDPIIVAAVAGDRAMANLAGVRTRNRQNTTPLEGLAQAVARRHLELCASPSGAKHAEACHRRWAGHRGLLRSGFLRGASDAVIQTYGAACRTLVDQSKGRRPLCVPPEGWKPVGVMGRIRLPDLKAARASAVLEYPPVGVPPDDSAVRSSFLRRRLLIANGIDRAVQLAGRSRIRVPLSRAIFVFRLKRALRGGPDRTARFLQRVANSPRRAAAAISAGLDPLVVAGTLGSRHVESLMQGRGFSPSSPLGRLGAKLLERTTGVDGRSPGGKPPRLAGDREYEGLRNNVVAAQFGLNSAGGAAERVGDAWNAVVRYYKSDAPETRAERDVAVRDLVESASPRFGGDDEDWWRSKRYDDLDGQSGDPGDERRRTEEARGPSDGAPAEDDPGRGDEGRDQSDGANVPDERADDRDPPDGRADGREDPDGERGGDTPEQPGERGGGRDEREESGDAWSVYGEALRHEESGSIVLEYAGGRLPLDERLARAPDAVLMDHGNSLRPCSDPPEGRYEVVGDWAPAFFSEVRVTPGDPAGPVSIDLASAEASELPVVRHFALRLGALAVSMERDRALYPDTGGATWRPPSQEDDPEQSVLFPEGFGAVEQPSLVERLKSACAAEGRSFPRMVTNPPEGGFVVYGDPEVAAVRAEVDGSWRVVPHPGVDLDAGGSGGSRASVFAAQATAYRHDKAWRALDSDLAATRIVTVTEGAEPVQVPFGADGRSFTGKAAAALEAWAERHPQPDVIDGHPAQFVTRSEAVRAGCVVDSESKGVSVPVTRPAADGSGREVTDNVVLHHVSEVSKREDLQCVAQFKYGIQDSAVPGLQVEDLRHAYKTVTGTPLGNPKGPDGIRRQAGQALAVVISKEMEADGERRDYLVVRAAAVEAGKRLGIAVRFPPVSDDTKSDWSSRLKDADSREEVERYSSKLAARAVERVRDARADRERAPSRGR